MSRDLLSGTTLRQRADRAVHNDHVRVAISSATERLAAQKAVGTAALDDYDDLRDAARAVRAEVLADLPGILERLADNVEANGGHVFFAKDAAEATDYVAAVAKRTGSKVAVKSKSMASEEIHLNDVLEAAGVEVVETDLGEWIIQLAQDTPAHIITPAIHMTRDDIADLFNRVAGGDLSSVPEDLCAFARTKLRAKFLEADLGISGVNFGVAETGSIVIVTNEGNGRLTTSVPRTHVAIMGMERVVQRWDQLDLLLALLPKAATGQQITTYVNTITGPRRPGELDGPDELHLVILDNGRSDILGTELQEILHCIRCGACLNACPVYRQIGGHGYGWVYSGPVGAVLTPLLNRAEEAGELSDASTLCGACWDACPVGIPLQDLLLSLRRERSDGAKATTRAMWRGWSEAWSRPASYRASTRAGGISARILPERAIPGRWSAGRQAPRPSSGHFRTWFEKGGA